VLDGVRGQPAANVDALATAVVALSWLAHDLGDHLEALDATPSSAERMGASPSTRS
jgi:hypothetical protein